MLPRIGVMFDRITARCQRPSRYGKTELLASPPQVNPAR